MDIEYLSRAKVQETEREIIRVQLAAAAEGTKAHHYAAAAPKPRTVSAIPLRLLRALRPAS